MRWLGIALAAVFALSAAPAMAVDASLSPEANAKYLADYAQKRGVIVRPSGLEYRIIQNGFGRRPSARDTVTVYYKGSLINGTVFDSTEPGLPATFPISGLIQGWKEALGLMREGDHWEIVIPGRLGYGSRGAGDAIPPDQTLVFDMELVSMTPAPPERHDDDQ